MDYKERKELEALLERLKKREEKAARKMFSAQKKGNGTVRLMYMYEAEAYETAANSLSRVIKKLRRGSE